MTKLILRQQINVFWMLDEKHDQKEGIFVLLW
jgi:membrane protein implicated in regulation of membrane protease activity